MSRRPNLPVALPPGWSAVPLRALARRRDETGRPDLPLLSVYRDFGVVQREGREGNFNKPGMDLGTYRVVHPGDLVINKMKTWQGSLGVSWHQGIVSPAYFVCGLNDRVDRRFLHYLLRSQPYIAEYGARSKGIRPDQWDLPWDEFKSIHVAVPPSGMQLRIADFLDRETARLDGLIDAKKSLIGRLEERWRSEVIKTVTQGLLNDDLLPVDSPWFARVPRSWRLEALKRRWSVIDCKHRTPGYTDRGFPLVSHGEIEDGRVYPGRSGRFVEERDYLDLIEGRRPKRGDVIYTRNAAIGNAGYVDTEERFAMGQDVCLITSDSQDQRFLTYFLNYVAIDQLAARRLGATFGRINVAQIVDLQVMCPPPAEQRLIADHLDSRRETYESLNRRIRQQVVLLAELRRAVVTAAVTGHGEVFPSTTRWLLGAGSSGPESSFFQAPAETDSR